MIISPFTPIFFEHSKSDRLASRYVQTFSKEDRILIECLCSNEERPDFKIAKEGDDAALWRPMTFQSWQVNPDTTLHFAIIHGLENGTFKLVDETNGYESYPFRVTNDIAKLRNTTLIQYSMENNRSRTDAVFLIDGIRHFFSFRVPGGFKDSDWTFGVDTEQFTTPDGDICTLYSRDSVQKRFTMGCADGVPSRFAELLNRLLTCTYVYFDGVRYSRTGSNVPEQTELSSDIDSFVYKITVQKIRNLNPVIENSNYVSIRRDYESEDYMTAEDYNILTE